MDGDYIVDADEWISRPDGVGASPREPRRVRVGRLVGNFGVAGCRMLTDVSDGYVDPAASLSSLSEELSGKPKRQKLSLCSVG